MKKGTKKRLVNHKLYCGKYYARIGCQFKELDISSRDMAILHSVEPKEQVIDLGMVFTYQEMKWIPTASKITHGNAYHFPKLEIEAITTEGY